MNASTLAGSLIRVLEGEKLTAYQDTGGVWTIGIGHTGPDVHEGLVWTQEQASAQFAIDAAPLFQLVAEEPLVAAAAYVSFGYNCGRSALEMLLEGNLNLNTYGIHDHHGNLLPGLVARRALEAALIASVSPITA